MNTIHIVAGSLLTAAMALVSPTHAGVLGGGAGGSFGGGLGGGLSGFGAHGLSGTGMMSSQGSLSGSVPTANSKAVTKTVSKVDDKSAEAAQSAKNKAASVASMADDKATSTGAKAADLASSTSSKANGAVSSATTTASAAGTASVPATGTKPIGSAAGKYTQADSGSLDAQHTKTTASLTGEGGATLK